MRKFLVFKSAWTAGANNNLFYYLVVIGVINSAISWYYYLKVIVVMYFSELQTEYKKPVIATSLATALLLTAFGTIYLGVLPNSVLGILEKARDTVALKR